MEEYIVSARKYRPITFDTVVGQRTLTTTLLNAIKTSKLAHAYLFCGPRGVGKTTCARIFAKTINCTNPHENGEACNLCESCKAFDEGRSMNIHELDAASNNSVEDIRELIQQVQIPPQTGRYKVFIIDEIHMLSASAFNAFLKTLEEPPSYVIFIMATTEKHKILPTILSRCQVFDFARMTLQNTVEHLRYVAQKEGYTADEESLNLIAQKADGGMRDALSIFDQMVSFTGGNITYQQTLENLNVLDLEYYFRLVDLFLKHEVEPCLILLNEIIQKGFDPGIFIGGLAAHLRNLMVSRDPQTLPLLETSETTKKRYQEQAARCQPKFLYRTIKLCNDCDQNYRTSRNKRLQVEICLIQSAQEDDSNAGHCPKIILPLFNAPQAKPTEQQSVVTANTSTATPHNASITNNLRVQDSNTLNAIKSSENSEKNLSSPQVKTDIKKENSPKIKTIKGILAPSLSIKNTSNKNHEEKRNIKQNSENVQKEENRRHLELAPSYLEEHDMSMYWREIANTLPLEHKALAQRMLDIIPTIITKTHFAFTVNNEMVKESFQSIMPIILNYIRKKFNNESITCDIEVAKIKSAPVISKTEILIQMKEKNKSFCRLVESLKLELE